MWSLSLPAIDQPLQLGALGTWDEYGNPITTPTQTGAITYGWLGGKERALDTTGLTLMGVRLYNSSTGLFTSPDPVEGGNTTAYVYPQDPINDADIDGRAACKGWRKWACGAGKVLSFASSITAWCPFAQCQAATLALGGLGAAGYAIGGNRKAAISTLKGTAINLVFGGRGKISSLIPRAGKYFSKAKKVISRVDGRRGGITGLAWSRASRVKDRHGRVLAKSYIAAGVYFNNAWSSGWYKTKNDRRR